MVDVGLTVAQLAAVLGFSVGFLWGEVFSRFDEHFKFDSDWFHGLTPFKQWFVASVLDCMHHFQYGLGLVLFVAVYGESLPAVVQVLLVYVGWGLVVSDWRDYKNVLKRFGLVQEGEVFGFS